MHCSMNDFMLNLLAGLEAYYLKKDNILRHHFLIPETREQNKQYLLMQLPFFLFKLMNKVYLTLSSLASTKS
jgi:hypothetical protein